MMGLLRDKTGYEWTFSVDFGVVLDWKAECKLDLGDAEHAIGRMASVLTTDPFAVAELAWVVCRAEAKALGVNREEFIRRLPGDTDTLRDLVSEGVLLFFLGRKRGMEMLPSLQRLLRGESISNESDLNSEETLDLTPSGSL